MEKQVNCAPPLCVRSTGRLDGGLRAKRFKAEMTMMDHRRNTFVFMAEDSERFQGRRRAAQADGGEQTR